MAYAALVSLAQTIDQILNHPQYSISVQEKQQIISLDKYVLLFQAFLEEFPEKADNLEWRLGKLANQAEDIIEYLMLEHIRSRDVESGYHSSGKYERQLKRVTEEMDSIAAEVMEIKDSFRVKDVQLDGDSSAVSSSSRAAPIHKDAMVGFDDDLLAIKTRLCVESANLQVLPIVGMGGIGKTTLAKNVYDDPLIMEHFDIRSWVTVSQDYSVAKILSSLLGSLNELGANRIGGSYGDKVFKSLKGRRYLIVMDDMWSTKAWDDLRYLFPNDGNGSGIILTTRLSDVAAYPGPSTTSHKMRFMNVHESWKLLRQKVFKDEDCPPELEYIGKEIARSCTGLPLAIVVVAGLLATISKTRISWTTIAENLNSIVSAKHEKFEAILSLSYTHLPHHLRPCFLYMGFFSEDHEIRVSKLIKLWGAEGFLKCRNGSKSLEEEAEECLKDLIKRSLVLVTTRKSNGEIKSCGLHDVMRDLCIRKAHEENFLVNFRGGYAKKFFAIKSRENQHCRSIAPFALPYLSKFDGSNIRTIMCFDRISAVLDSLKSFRLLKILDLEDARLHSSLPDQLFELFLLRYLAMFEYDYHIPPAISKLQNLQTLINHERCRDFHGIHARRLPQEIWSMPQLRHIIGGVLPSPEGTTSALENLQTLTLLQSYCICTEETLKMIPNLKKLEIDCFNYPGGTYLNNLVYLHQLEDLELYNDTFVKG